MVPVAGLTRWIDALRDRLLRGELAGLSPFDLGHGTHQLPGETTIRVMLHDLADLDSPSGSWGGNEMRREGRRRHLLDDFRRLRELLG